MSESTDAPSPGDHMSSLDVNFLDLDLNLLIALDALLTDQSVTKAAARLHRSQPALSASLKRLRHQFQDDLLVRSGNIYELTPLATQLKSRVALLMADVEQLFATRSRFDPGTSTRSFTLHVSDYGQQMLGRAVAEEMAVSAPNARLNFEALVDKDFDNIEDRLRNTDGFVLPLGMVERLPHLEVYTDNWVLLVDREHPLDHTLSTDDLGKLDWVTAFNGADHSGGWVPIMRQLQLLGVKVNTVVAVHGFASLPWFIKGTRRVAMIQEGLARRIAPTDEFRLLPCPFEPVPLVECFWWHPTLSKDPGHTWLRSIVEVAGSRIRSELAGRP